MTVVLALLAAMASTLTGVRLAAQGTTATILGTVTDASGGAIPEAVITVVNLGTSANQSMTTDSQGRYRVPTLPIGTYEVRAAKNGFQSQARTGIVLSVGSETVVDFALTVGQVTEVVTVEAEAVVVETTSSAISTLVAPEQMRELPLNGRNYEQLLLLVPGVTVHKAIGYQPVNGMGDSYSVSGSRTRGQWQLIDGNNVMNFQGRNAGSGVLGTQLGVDAIAEFQVLTNTYSAQFGGNGAVMNAVTRSGTNSLHGSLYEFFRNSALDARNYFDPPDKPLFQKNQFGGTLGGPILRDKVFFFFNYEGIRQNQSQTYPYLGPDEAGLNGYTPTNGVYTCVNDPSIPYTPENYAACRATIPEPIQALLPFFPKPSDWPYVANVDANGNTNGIITQQITKKSPAGEDYFMGRFDWTISDKDSLYGSYIYDRGHIYAPFSGSPPSDARPAGVGANNRSRNQYLSVGERRLWSGRFITWTRLGYVRTLNAAASVEGNPIFNFGQPDLWAEAGVSETQFPSGPQGTISILPLVNPNITFPQLGGAVAFSQIQNKYSVKEDISYFLGAHSLQFGVAIERVHTNLLGDPLALPVPGTWTFRSMTDFLMMRPSNGTALCNSSVWEACEVLPLKPVNRNLRENTYAFYIQDNWQLRSNLTLNLGLRYDPLSNPVSTNPFYSFQNMYLSESYDPSQPMPGCVGPRIEGCTGTLPQGTLPGTLTNHIYLKNPTLHNFGPRIGIAWAPFGDQKTSIRAGYGIFYSPVLPYDYVTAAVSNTQYVTASFLCPTPDACNTFPLPPFSSGASARIPPFAGTGVDPGSKHTPYIQQYNATLQRELFRNTVVSVSYIGSRSVHLIGGIDLNPPLPSGVPGAIAVPAGRVVLPYPAIAQFLTGGTPSAPASADGQPIVNPETGQMSYANVMCNEGTLTSCSVVSNVRVNRTLDISQMRKTDFIGKYNSLQVGVVRRMANNLQGQISYTLASCLSNSSGTTGFENGLAQTNPWDSSTDMGNCAFLIRHNLSINGMYMLPFTANRLVSGWQVAAIVNHHTGQPISISTGWPSGIIIARGGPIPSRPSLVPGCQEVLGRVDKWFDTSCYYQPPIGEMGDTPAFSVIGPGFTNFDFSVTKNTRVGEAMNVQFRAEIFNIFNHTNFRNPGQPMSFVFQQVSPLPASCASEPSTCSRPLNAAGQLFLTNGIARQIQFGLKFTF